MKRIHKMIGLLSRKKPQSPVDLSGLVPAITVDDLMSLFPELSEHRERILETEPSLGEIGKNDQILGTVESPLARWLNQCTNYYMKRAGEEQLRAKFGDASIKAECHEAYCRYDQQADAIKEMMWLAIKMELGCWHSDGGGGLSLRKGWKVVKIPREGPEIMFRKLFGDQED